MKELTNSSNKNYWVARDSTGDVLHTGETNPNQVTTTGLDVLEHSEDEAEQVGFLSNFVDKFPDLPIEGEPVEERVYNHNGSPIKCIQAHTRTHRTIDEEPALWVKPKQDFEQWVQPTGSHDAYQTSDIVTYEGQQWISKIDANVTVPDGDEPFNRYWEPYKN